jgi:hypothetical protein
MAARIDDKVRPACAFDSNSLAWIELAAASMRGLRSLELTDRLLGKMQMNRIIISSGLKTRIMCSQRVVKMDFFAGDNPLFRLAVLGG